MTLAESANGGLLSARDTQGIPVGSGTSPRRSSVVESTG
jgi:hypothetical protein